MNKLRIDTEAKLCYIEDNVVNLTKIEYELLLFLLNNKNKIFSRQELVNEVWKTKVSLRAVDAAISRIRKKVGQSYIKTRQGFGYGMII